MHDLNLEEMMPRYAPPVKPAGQLKLQLNFADERTTLNIFIIEVSNLLYMRYYTAVFRVLH